MDPKPTIDLDSPQCKRKATFVPKFDPRVYCVMKKFRNRQRLLLESNDIQDPDPFLPSYIFYCFQKKEDQ